MTKLILFSQLLYYNQQHSQQTEHKHISNITDKQHKYQQTQQSIQKSPMNKSTKKQKAKQKLRQSAYHQISHPQNQYEITYSMQNQSKYANHDYVSPLPYSLDPLILQDCLLQTLKRSPQTSSYIVDRVKQIIFEIVCSPIVRELQGKIEQLQAIIYKLEQQNESMSQNYAKQKEKNANTKDKQVDRIKQLQRQMFKFKDVQGERNRYKLQLEELQSKNKGLYQRIRQQQDRYLELHKLNQNTVKQVERVSQQKQQIAKTLLQRQQQNRFLNQQLEKIKKLCKQTKFNEIKYKKQFNAGLETIQKLTIQLNQCKQQMRVEKVHRDNERKALHVKLNNLYKQNKSKEKGKKKLLKMQTQVQGLRGELTKYKEVCGNYIKKIQEQVRKSSQMMMDYIGEQVHKQLKQVMGQMSKMTTQIRILKQQVKIKDDIIQKLEKISSVQLMGNKELQRQLKYKKLQSDGLRKQLKKNYEESEVKLMGIQNSYRDILINAINYPR